MTEQSRIIVNMKKASNSLMQTDKKKLNEERKCKLQKESSNFKNRRLKELKENVKFMMQK